MTPPTLQPATPAPQVSEISLRDHFAGLAMNGIIAADPDNCIHAHDPALNGHASLAKTCYRLADAMLAAGLVTR
jgi:hypothetical protein